jgi:hypothetical protein
MICPWSSQDGKKTILADQGSVEGAFFNFLQVLGFLVKISVVTSPAEAIVPLDCF